MILVNGLYYNIAGGMCNPTVCIGGSGTHKEQDTFLVLCQFQLYLHIIHIV